MESVNAAATMPALAAGRPTFASVAEAELDAVHAYLLFLTGDRSVAEDVAGETFEKAFRLWRRFDPRRGTARAWLCSIARSAALDHLRAEERRRRRELRYARETRTVDEPSWGDGAAAAGLRQLGPAGRGGGGLGGGLGLPGATTGRILG